MMRLGVILLFIFLPGLVLAEPGIPALTLSTGEDGSQSYSLTLQILALMTVLTLLPAALLMMTSFTRIIIVLAILRQAMGVQSTPSNQILIGLALFLTFFIMSPVLSNAYENGVQPYMDGEIEATAAIEQVSLPFMNLCWPRHARVILPYLPKSVDTLKLKVLMPYRLHYCCRHLSPVS